ncbi:MAG: MBL fold metallo-hydrolase [Gemmatimonadaceae bacterium]|nr:MBL fold metallo-hydrolase [Gemmatimonadaceae bacterium]
MLRVTVLGSGSRGNAILIDGTESSVLVDVGFGPRLLARRFALADRRPDHVAALLLTHEHVDHASGARAASTRWRWPVHAVPETLQALADSPDGGPSQTRALSFAVSTSVCGFDVVAIAVPHDARACAALVLTDRASGARVGVALDLGHVPAALPAAIADCDLLVIESNHDERMLAEGPYPWPLKQRIGGPLGHLSNGATASLLASVSHRGLRGVILAHLSQTNNTPLAAISRSREALRRAGWRRDGVWAASQSVPCGPIGADGAIHGAGMSQLSLGL